MKKKCLRCEKELKGRQKKFCSRNCKDNICKKRLRERKKKFLSEYKTKTGCQICGYKEHPEILVFHHKTPLKRKTPNPSNEILRHSSNTTIKIIKEELKKVLVLCPNCHTLLHYQK